jgi:urease accessory protein
MGNGADRLGLFQLTDSFFPSGGFAYSRGLETYVSEGLVRDAEGLQAFIQAYLRGLVSRGDVLVAGLCREAVGRGDLETVFRLDHLLHTMKISRESREASLQTGRQLLKVMDELHRSPVLKGFREGIAMGKAWGHHAAVFGPVCQVLGIAEDDTVLSFLYQIVSAVVSAGVRLIPIGHTEGQRVLESSKPTILDILADVATLGEADIASFGPGLEIGAMRHEHLYTRMFRS